VVFVIDLVVNLCHIWHKNIGAGAQLYLFYYIKAQYLAAFSDVGECSAEANLAVAKF